MFIWTPSGSVDVAPGFFSRHARVYPAELRLFVDRSATLGGPWTEVGHANGTGSTSWSTASYPSIYGSEDPASAGFTRVQFGPNTFSGEKNRFYRLRIVKP